MNSRLSANKISRWRAAVVAAGIVLGGNFAAAADPSAPVILLAPARPPAALAPPVNYDSFRYIGDANIFNPYRVGRSANEAAAPAVETITLVGTMRYEKGLFAFFDSPESAYRKALHEGDTIAQYTVKRITADQVDLTRDSKQISLVMGQQLRRPPGGDWSVGFAPRPNPGPAADTPPVIPADATDLLKRLMERRQKELKQ